MEKQTVDQLITEYLPNLHGFAMQKCFSIDEAEDLCAEIIHEVYISLLRAKEIYNLEGYIWRISEHTYSKYVASKKRHEGVSIDGMAIPYYQDFSFGDADEDIARLRREIAFLSAKRREIVYLFYYENKSISFISETLGIPEGTVKLHLNKSRNELKEGFLMARKIGKLGISPIKAIGFGHHGTPDPERNTGTEYYLEDKLNLNIVYSVYFVPKTTNQIAEELSVTPVFIEDKISFLTENGFLVPTSGDRYTTYVKFSPKTYSLELAEKRIKEQFEIAKMLAKEYVPAVREAIADVDEVYIPGGNRELLEAAAIFWGVEHMCSIPFQKDLSDYVIKTTAGGEFIATVTLPAKPSDPEYKGKLRLPNSALCGDMRRFSEKYPVTSWSMDTRYCSREGYWQNNLTSDYEYLYEFIQDMLSNNSANADKLKRLKKRQFITKDNQVNIMVVKGTAEDFFSKIPPLDEEFKKKCAGIALEYAMQEAKNYPPQMQDLIVFRNVTNFIGPMVALFVMDVLYGNEILKPLTKNEKITSHLIMFSDILP